MKEEYWTTKDKRVIAVGEMSEAHVKNCLRILIRRLREIEKQEELDDNVGSFLQGTYEYWRE